VVINRKNADVVTAAAALAVSKAKDFELLGDSTMSLFGILTLLLCMEAPGRCFYEMLSVKTMDGLSQY